MKYLKRYKIFEDGSYYQDDINVEITSTVIDILQDFIDEGLTIHCFTIGYITLKQCGATYTDNDISLFIMANGDNDVEYKTLDYKRLLPDLERIIDYMKSEDREVEVKLQWRENIPKNPRSWKFSIIKEMYCKGEDLGSVPDNNYESISMKFKLI